MRHDQVRREHNRARIGQVPQYERVAMLVEQHRLNVEIPAVNPPREVNEWAAAVTWVLF